MRRRWHDILSVVATVGSLLLVGSLAAGQSRRGHGSAVREPMDPLTARGVELYEQHHYAEARTMLTRAVTTSPDAAAALAALGRLLLEVDCDLEGAVANLERAVALAPASARVHAWLGQALTAQATRDSMYKAAAVAKRGRTELEAAVSFAPRDPEVRIALMRFYLKAPTLVGGSVERAREQAVEAGHLSQVLGMQAEGEIAEAERDFRGAEAHYREAVAADPGDVSACNTLGYFLLRRRNALAAVEVLNGCVRMAASDPNAHDSLAEGLLAAGKVDEATAEYQRALGLDPEFASSHLGLGLCLERKAKWSEAREAYQRCLAAQPRGPLADQARARLKEIAYRRG
jgi:tetratricopeptide (TPR) repeat protein